MRRPRRGRLAAAACLLAVSSLVSTADASSRARFLERGRPVEVERLGPPAPDARGRTLTPVLVTGPGRPSFRAKVGRTAIVRLEPGASSEILARAGGRPLRALMPSAGLWLVEVDETAAVASDIRPRDGLDLASDLSDDAARAAGVRYASPNLYLRAVPHGAYVPDDPRLPAQWYFTNLAMTEAWGLSQGDPATTIVIVDTGCDATHPDLGAKLDPGLDVVDGDDDPTFDPAMQGAAHGTACAGVAAAVTDNGEGIAGACPACRLRCVRMLSGEPEPISATVEAYQFALEVGAAVVSNSWGFEESIPAPEPIADAIQELFDHGRGGRGALVLFAAGNDDRELLDEELTGVRGVLTVGAINNLDEQTSFTNYGQSVDLVSPTGTLTTDIAGPSGDSPNDYTSSFGGTSSACPVAAGVAGLLVSAAPETTAAELYDVLIASTKPAPFAEPDERGHDPVYGYGIVDPVRALRTVLGLETGAGGEGGATPAEPAPASSPAQPSEPSGCACASVAGGPNEAALVALGLYAAAWRLRRRRRT